MISIIGLQQRLRYLGDIPPDPDPTTDNFSYEDEYYSAYFLTKANASNLQSALNTYGSVRLEIGTYTGTGSITLTSGMKLYGHHFLTKINATINIAAGAENIHLESIEPNNIVFQTGGVTKNNVIKSVKFTDITCTNCTITDNLFLNLDRCQIKFDCSTSGYFRNNRFIKTWTHGSSPQTVMKGNNTTPSYGNVELWRNYLTPNTDAAIIENLDDYTLVGADSEGWNLTGEGTKAMQYVRDVDRIKIFNISGYAEYSPGDTETPPFDLQGGYVYMSNRDIGSTSLDPPIIRTGTDIVYIEGTSTNYVMEDSNDLNLQAHHSGTAVNLNGVNQTSTIISGNAERIAEILLEEPLTPWDRPSLETVPNPTGVNWSSERVGKPDSASYIQGLIDTNNIAVLSDSIYYIGSTLHISKEQGIIGLGTGKTAIVGLTDDFPLITADDEGTFRFILAHLTLQGGSTGLHIPTTTEQVTGCTFKYVVFRNQNHAIHLDKIFGLDNNFFDNVSFVDCNNGLYQDPVRPYNGFDDMAYIDKVLFYQGQYINNTRAFNMRATRANNLDAWVDCVFDGNDIAVELSNNNVPFFANCDFKNHTGSYVIGQGSPFSLYSCHFYDNSVTTMFNTDGVEMEGCVLDDDINVFSSKSNMKAYIFNSEIAGDISEVDNGVFVNSLFDKHSGYNKLMINKVSSTVTTIIDQTSTPYPQLLVKH